MRDLYSILGVSHRANAAEIKAAYRIKAKLFHPDLHADDKKAENRIQEINYSYAVLSDSKARAAYDFKRILARMRTRRRGAAVAAAALAVFMITITTISVEWRREAASPPLAGHRAKLQPGSADGGSLIAETSEGGRANGVFSVRRTKEAASSDEFLPPEPAIPLKTETAAAIPPSNLQSEPLTALPPSPAPVPEAGPQTRLANAAPIENAAEQAAEAGEARRRPGGSRGTHRDRVASAKNQEKVAVRNDITKFARASLQGTQRDFEREPRLVSRSATALAWPSADEPFVNMGGSGR